MAQMTIVYCDKHAYVLPRSLALPLARSRSLSLSLPLCVSLSLSLSLSVSLCLSLSLSVSLCFSLSLSVSLCLSLCLSLSPSLPPSLSLSFSLSGRGLKCGHSSGQQHAWIKDPPPGSIQNGQQRARGCFIAWKNSCNMICCQIFGKPQGHGSCLNV